MRSLFTRAAQHKKGHRLTPVAFAVLAAAIYVIYASAVGKAAFRASVDDIITGSLPPSSALPDSSRYLNQASKGQEGIDLAARLTADGGFIQRPVEWQIFQRDAELGTIGKSVFKAKTPFVEASIKPGVYRIEVKYGFASTWRDITVLPKTRVGVTFVLNVGGIRALSRVVGMDASHYSNATHAIYALPDNKPPKLITDKVAQGQTIRLPAGAYRIESRFDNGNTVASANVTIKPGILTSLNIDHQAAFARLSFRKPVDKIINWKVHSLKSNWTRTGKSTDPAMVLAPGRYIFSAKIGSKQYSRTVSLDQGKATIIVLGK